MFELNCWADSENQVFESTAYGLSFGTNPKLVAWSKLIASDETPRVLFFRFNRIPIRINHLFLETVTGKFAGINSWPSIFFRNHTIRMMALGSPFIFWWMRIARRWQV